MNVSPGPDLHFLYSGLTYCHKTSGAYRLKPARQTATQEMREAEKTELKNANGYVIAPRHRTWAQARAHLK